MVTLPGASNLDDRYTNVFCIAEVTGLNWVCLTTPSPTTSSQLADDIVLKSYADCIKSNLLCTWRRKPVVHDHSFASNDLLANFNIQNELWIFWYTKEGPKIIDELKNGGLTVFDEKDSSDKIFDYEIRLIFFKALHAALERKYYKEGFIRLGNWFAKPFSQTPGGSCLPRYTNGVNFEFFLHRDNYVCMILRVQRQPALVKLNETHIRSKKPLPIILGPWSLKATLIQPLKESEMSPEMKQMKGKECCYWNRYIIQSKEKEKVEMMLVELAGIKMFYPTNYICLLADEISTDEAKPVDMNDNLSRENRVKSLNANHRKDPSGSYFVSKIFIDAVLPENSYSNNIQILDYRRSSDCTCELCNPKENIEQITKPIEYNNPSPFHGKSNQLKVSPSLNAICSWTRKINSHRPLRFSQADPFSLSSDLRMMKNLRCSAKLPRPKNAKSSDRREQPEEHIGDKTVRLVTNNNNSELQSLLNAKPDYQEDHPPSSAMKYLLLGDSLAHPTENPSKRHTSESDYSSKSDYLSHKPQIRKQTNRSVNGVRKIIFWPNLQNAIQTHQLSYMDTIQGSEEFECKPENSDYSNYAEPMQIDENYENITATPPSFIGQYSQYDAVQQNNPLSADESRLHTFEGDIFAQDHMLSPPASNEQVDLFSHQSSSHFQVKPNGVNNIDSLNIIYPTPPTPAPFQPSPQAYIPCENDLTTVVKQWFNEKNEPSTSHFADNFDQILTSVGGKRSIFDEIEKSELPNNFSFEGTIIDISSISGRKKFCRNCKSTKTLELSLEKRSKRSRQLERPDRYESADIHRTKVGNNQRGRALGRHNSPLTNEISFASSMIPQNYSNGDQMGYFMPSNASAALNPNLTVESSRVSPAILSKNDIKTNSKEIDALIVVKMHSSEITMYLQDTIANFHFDPVFDASPICSCNANIRSSELGLYITAPKEIISRCDRIQNKLNSGIGVYNLSGFKITSELQKCKCGFSAVRHRFLCSNNRGLFYDDLIEASGPITLSLKDRTISTFAMKLKIALPSDRVFLAFVLQQCSLMELNKFNSPFMDLAPNSDAMKELHRSYLLSEVQKSELDGILRTLIKKTHGTNSAIDSKNMIHEWGYQIANTIDEPRDSEYASYFDSLKEFLRELRGTFAGRKCDHLTVRSFARKILKGLSDDEKLIRAEPIPSIIVGSFYDKELVVTSPQSVYLWDKLELAPYNQPKNVFYITVIPDNDVIAEKTYSYMEDLSSVYEKRHRFGNHLKVGLKDAPRDGLLRIGKERSEFESTRMNSLWAHFADCNIDESKFAFLKNYTCNCISELLRFFRATSNKIFERRAFFESISQRERQRKLGQASNLDANIMPPPVIPMQSPSSILSSASGPSSSVSHFTQHSPSTVPSSIYPQTSGSQNVSVVSQEDLDKNRLLPPSVGQNSILIDQCQKEEAEIEKEVDEMLARNNGSHLPHIIVIYMVNPFYAENGFEDVNLTRLATISLMQAGCLLLHSIHPSRRLQIHFEFVDLRTILSSTFIACPLLEAGRTPRSRMSTNGVLRQMAFSVYSRTRYLTPRDISGSLVKSMTQFGPAASLKNLLESMTEDDFSLKKYCLPFILAPRVPRVIDSNVTTSNGSTSTNAPLISNRDERILFVSYCLIANEWLCVAAVDECGSMIESTLINISVSSPTSTGQWKCKNHSQIYDAIHRLWQYIQSLLIMSVKNWRLVIGRLGKIGHGEFKVWTDILSKRNLRFYNNSLNKNSGVHCLPCSQVHGYHDMPVILSASFISTEPELYIRVFPALTPNESSQGFSSSSTKQSKGASKQQSQTPPILSDDTSITHIMAFPTILKGGECEDQDQADDGDPFAFLLNDNPLKGDDDFILDFELEDGAKNDEESNINNQPMATGYSVSTAPLLFEMPESFWSACPSLKRRFPVNLKSSLHIHCSNIQHPDDYSTNVKSDHPLDSPDTDEVLRYIMETHNALSWLNVDFATGSRQSCLPIHVQVLLRLYNSLLALMK